MKTSILRYSLTRAGLFLLCLITLAACSGGSGGNSTQETVTNSIVGEWHYTYPATQCLETNIFRDNGDFVGTALDEVYSGFYSFEETVKTNTYHELTITLTEDNQQTDCKGRMSDGTGITRTVYVQFVEENKIVIYTKRKGGERIIDFQRQPEA